MEGNYYKHSTSHNYYMKWLEQKQMAADTTAVIIKSFGLNPEQIISVESDVDKSKACLWLDQFAGVDWMIKNSDNNVFGVAARTQFTNPAYYHDPHDSFTIRCDTLSGRKTELAKRMDAIQNGYFFPYFTLQAYFKKEFPTELLSAAIIRTKDLYQFVKQYPYKITSNRFDNGFKVVKWDELQSNGVPVKIIRPNVLDDILRN
jgi:hypothetical protein